MMYVGKMVEDGCKFVTDPYPTVVEAIAASKREWMTTRFYIIEINDQGPADGYYEAVRYV